jgi:DNA-binding LacI/PurR family transcriptional regulator
VLDPNVNRHVAVLMELDIGHPRTSFFFTRIVQSVRLQLESSGFRVRLYIGHTAPGTEFAGLTCHDFLEDVQANRISGVIAIALPSFPEWAHALVERNIPLVGGDAYGPVIDHSGMIRAGVRLLVEAGRKRLALIGSGGSAMTAVFRDTLKEYGLEWNASWVPGTGGQPAVPGLGWRLFRQIWSARSDQPDGLLVMDDMIFQDAAMAMLEADVRVPEQLLVVSESNRGHSIHCPFPVIRLENDPDDFAKVYARLMVDLLRNKAISESQVTMPFRVVEPEPAEEAGRLEAPARV